MIAIPGQVAEPDECASCGGELGSNPDTCDACFEAAAERAGD